MIKKAAVLVFMSLLLVGCADSKEIDERNFVISLGIDKGTDEKYEISMGVANPEINSEDSVGQEMKTGKGKTLVKAMKENESNFSRNMYYGHTKTILISDELLAEEGVLEEIIDSLMRSNEFSLKTIVLAVEGSAAQCIATVQTEDKGDGLYIWDFYKNNASYVENTTRMALKEVEVAVKSENSVILPSIKVENDKTVIGGGIIFDGAKKTGTLSGEDMTYYSLTVKNCEGYLLQVELETEEIPVFVTKTDCSIDAKEEQIIFNISVKGDMKGQGSSDAVDDKKIKSIEARLKIDLEKKIKDTLIKMKFIGVPELEDKEIEVFVETKIRGTGVIR